MRDGSHGTLLVTPGSGPATGAIAESGSGPRTGASRASRLTTGTRLLHADLHNHTLLSDGDGDPALAFDSMRSAGLDAAALTDHATLSDELLDEVLADLLTPPYTDVAGLTPAGWAQTSAYADAANVDGTFTAIRGFEWSEPLIGHVNVWFTEHYTDVVEAGVMRPLLEWLRREPGLVPHGGADGLAGFNHPGREPGRFCEFGFDPRVRDRMVSLEMFNRRDDYVFEGWAEGRPSPLVACLNAGWRTGIAGCSDEHGTDWGFPEGKGRTGVWVEEHSRRGLKEALRARRFFATRTSGLRVDATAVAPDGSAHRMGSPLPMTSGTVRFRLDLARDAEWVGRPLAVQVLRPGSDAPAVVHVQELEVGGVVEADVPLDVDDGDWVLLRVADPTQANATPGPDGHPCNDLGIAYTSPWWLEPPSG